MWRHQSLFIYSSPDGHLGHFPFVAVTIDAALIVHKQLLVWTYVLISLRHTNLGVELLGRMETRFSLLKNREQQLLN